MPERTDAHALASAALDVMRMESDHTAGVWPRAAALLGRQALELALADLWRAVAPGLDRTPYHCQLLCAGEMLNDHPLGGRVSSAWHVLSNGCHYRAYELPLTAAELKSALETVWELADATEQLRARMRRSAIAGHAS